MSAPEKDPKPQNEAGGDFLSRWSRRKVEAKEQQIINEKQVADDDASLVDADQANENHLTEEQLDELSDEEILEELGLPDPDTMKAGDDFKGFMKKTVPARIRNRALRKLWLTNPALANVDMLVDYGEDFTDAATVIPDMKTAYEVGKGIARRFEEMAEKLRLEEAEAEREQLASTEQQAEGLEGQENGESPQDLPYEPEQPSLDNAEALKPDATESIELRYQPDAEPVSVDMEDAEPVYVPRRMKFTV